MPCGTLDCWFCLPYQTLLRRDALRLSNSKDPVDFYGVISGLSGAWEKDLPTTNLWLDTLREFQPDGTALEAAFMIETSSQDNNAHANLYLRTGGSLSVSDFKTAFKTACSTAGVGIDYSYLGRLRSWGFDYPFGMVLKEGRGQEFLKLNGHQLVHIYRRKTSRFYRDFHGEPCNQKTAVKAAKELRWLEKQLEWERQGNEGPAPRWKPVKGSGIPADD